MFHIRTGEYSPTAPGVPIIRPLSNFSKTALQKQRDRRSFRIIKRYKNAWPKKPNRSHVVRIGTQDFLNPGDRRPRGINASGGWQNYQNVVHQALLHTPVFCKWILEHNDEHPVPHTKANCVRSSYKGLVQTYWGQSPHVVGGGPYILQQTLPALTQITNAAVANAARPLPLNIRGSGTDTMEFYSWVIDDMMRKPHAIPDPDPIWNELEARYRIDLRRLIMCRAPGCRTTTIGTTTPTPWLLSVDYDPGAVNSLIPMIYDYFELGTRPVYCAACGVIQPHSNYYRLEAAPQVLRIYVRLFGHQGNMPVKLCQTWEVPENLGFTLNQECGNSPLAYTLSSCIAHGGGDGHVERGLDGAYEDEYQLGEEYSDKSEGSALALTRP